MALIEEGRICVLRAGRNAGKKVIVIELDSKGKATVEGTVVKRRKVNQRHLFPTAAKASVRGNSKEEIQKALKEGI